MSSFDSFAAVFHLKKVWPVRMIASHSHSIKSGIDSRHSCHAHKILCQQQVAAIGALQFSATMAITPLLRCQNAWAPKKAQAAKASNGDFFKKSGCSETFTPMLVACNAPQHSPARALHRALNYQVQGWQIRFKAMTGMRLMAPMLKIPSTFPCDQLSMSFVGKALML